MSVGLDTSVVVRLIIGDPPQQAEAAWRFVEDAASASPPLVSDLVVAEAYYALRHHYTVPHDEAVAHLHGLLSDPRVSAAGVAATAVSSARSARAAIGLVDRMIHADYTLHGVPLVTFDKATRALAGVTVLDA